MENKSNQQPNQQPYGQPMQARPITKPPKQTQPLGIASLIVGAIAAIVAFLSPIIGILVGLAAIALGIVGKVKRDGAMSIVGIILGSLGIIIAIINWIVTMAYMSTYYY